MSEVSKPHSRDDFAALREAIPTLAEQKDGPAELWRVGHDALDALNRIEEQYGSLRGHVDQALYIIEAWENDETPDVDENFDSDASFIECVARLLRASSPATSPMAESYPPPEDVERAGELARERGWAGIGGQGVVSDPASGPPINTAAGSCGTGGFPGDPFPASRQEG